MLQQEKLIDVRGVLERNCTTTSVDELRSQGRSRVKVINAKQISALIEEAVARTIEVRRSVSSEDSASLIEASRVEFQKLVAEREQELREVRAAMDAVERERESLRSEVAEKQALEDTVTSAREELQRLLGSPNLEDLESVLQSFTARERSEEGQRIEALTQELEELESQSRELGRRAEVAARERDAALRERDQALAACAGFERQLSSASDTQQRRTAQSEAVNAEAMSAILSELKHLKDTVERAPAAAAAQPALDASQLMESLGEAMEKKMDKLGRRLGMSQGPAMGEGISFDGLFNSVSGMESNLEQVEVKERESSGIQDAVARMKAMRLGKPSGEAPSE